MDEEVDLLTDESYAELHLSHRRILVLITIAGALGALAGATLVNPRFGLGVLTGSILALANYFWQRRSMRRIFEKAARGEKPFFPAFAYILRYVVLGAVVWSCYVTDALPVIAVVAGLATFAMAIVIEGLIGIFSSRAVGNF